MVGRTLDTRPDSQQNVTESNYTVEMALIDKLVPGEFCWMELGTTDQNAAKHFYESLLGWKSNDFPMGPSEAYTIFNLNGRDCAAAYTLRKDQLEHHVPPHWMLYIATENADESSRRAGELGATVLAGPFDVGDKGRMSVVKDPTGAYFSLWQPKESIGIGVAGVDNAFCWADLNTPDRDGARKFYSALFGWKFEPGEGKDDSGYLHIKNGEHMIGGLPPAGMTPPGTPPHWMLYFQVADCDAAVTKLTGMGGRVYMPPTTIEGAGRMSVVTDQQGAGFSLFKLTM